MHLLRKIRTGVSGLWQITDVACLLWGNRSYNIPRVGLIWKESEKKFGAVRKNKEHLNSDVLQPSFKPPPVSYLFLRGGTLCLRCQGCVTSNAPVMDRTEGGLRVRSFCALQTLWVLRERSVFGGFIYCSGRCRKCACLGGRRTAPPRHLKHSMIWRRYVLSPLTHCVQILPNCISRV